MDKPPYLDLFHTLLGTSPWPPGERHLLLFRVDRVIQSWEKPWAPVLHIPEFYPVPGGNDEYTLLRLSLPDPEKEPIDYIGAFPLYAAWEDFGTQVILWFHYEGSLTVVWSNDFLTMTFPSYYKKRAEAMARAVEADRAWAEHLKRVVGGKDK